MTDKAETEYRIGPWAIHYDPPPIPVRNCDWHFTHDDDDGAPDGSCARSGHGESLQDCLNQIADILADEAALSRPTQTADAVEAAAQMLELEALRLAPETLTFEAPMQLEKVAVKVGKAAGIFHAVKLLRDNAETLRTSTSADSGDREEVEPSVGGTDADTFVQKLHRSPTPQDSGLADEVRKQGEFFQSKKEESVEAGQMGLRVALNFGDQPFRYDTLRCPADSIEEVRTALQVVSRQYRRLLFACLTSVLRQPRNDGELLREARDAFDYIYEVTDDDHCSIRARVESAKINTALARLDQGEG